MSRRTILITFIALVVVALGVWVYIESNKTTSTGGTASTSLFGSFFPFGSGKVGSTTAIPGRAAPAPVAGDQNSMATTAQKRLVKVTDKSVAGFIGLPFDNSSTTVPVYNINDTSGKPLPVVQQFPMVRFAERGTGYIYDTSVVGQNLSKVSGTVIDRTAIALFLDQGASIAYRYIKTDNMTIATFLGHIGPATNGGSIGQVTGSFLSDNIVDAVVSPDTKSLFVLIPQGDGVVGMTMKSDGTAKKQVFASPFSEWLADWSSAGAEITTKAANGVDGYSYTVLPSGVLLKTVGDIDGLTTKISPNGKSLLYSLSTDTSVDLHIRRLTDNADIDTGLSTLPEKCTWSPDSLTAYCGAQITPILGTYPDSWYQGTTHFSDALWSIDAQKGTTTELDDGEGNALDMTNLGWAGNAQYLLFTNKTDGSLWSFNLAPAQAAPAAPALPTVQ